MLSLSWRCVEGEDREKEPREKDFACAKGNESQQGWNSVAVDFFSYTIFKSKTEL